MRLRITAPNVPPIWHALPPGTAGRGSDGRWGRRSIRAADIDPETIDFPHATQVFRLRRDRAGLDGVRTSKEIVYGITNLTTELAGPAQMIGHARGHWTAENKVHYVHDVTLGEDDSQVRIGNASEPWHRCATSRSGYYGKPARPTSPKPYATTLATSPDH